ncbi:MAG: M28 family peptidase, partial [Bacteroidales bacterium]|nr:M28 family peptidase [Bacteroidales bacterium]
GKSPAPAVQPAGNTAAAQKTLPVFSADSAYHYIAQQLDFGPRVPGSAAQKNCAAWLNSELTRHGAKVYEMHASAKAYDGTELPIINLVGSFNTEAANRVLILSHWDSRHIADEDPVKENRTKPVPAANDGASGVGVILELARLFQQQAPQMGVDLFLTDAEDYGAPDNWPGQHREDWWALGTQEWCKQPHVANYRATFGILLDMVGAKDATFYREFYSDRYASDIVNMVWQKAQQLGYGRYFINAQGGGITDDHVFVNQMRRIPCIDIIDTRQNSGGSFYPYWHTTDDTLDKISKETLQAVGDVLINILY